MLELFTLGAVLTFGVVAIVGLVLGAVLLKVLFWLVLLPFRLLFWLVLLPVLLLKAFIGLAVAAVMTVAVLPLMVLATLLALVAVATALALPALLVLLAAMGVLWLFRSPARPVQAGA